MRSVLDRAPSMFSFWDRDLRCLFASVSCERWFGVETQGLVGTSMQDLLGPSLFELHEPHVRAALKGKELGVKLVAPGANGSQRHGMAQYVPVSVNGEVQGVVAHLTDETPDQETELRLRAAAVERERVTDRLRKDEAALRQAQRLGQIGSWHWESGANLMTWSDELYRIFGLDPTRPPPARAALEHIYTALSWSLLQPAEARLLAHGEPYTLELEHVLPGGANGWIEARGAAERDGRGAIVGLHGTAQDITARRAHREPATGEDFRDRLEAPTPGVVHVFDLEHQRNVYLSRSVARLLGYTAEEVSAKEADLFLALLHPDDRLRFGEHHEHMRLARDDETTDFEFRLRGRAGEWRWFQSHDAVFSRTDRGEVREIIGTAIEIAAHKPAEQSLRQEILERRQAQAARGQQLEQAYREGQRLADVFRQAPAFMCVLRGPDLVFEMANDRYQKLVGHRKLLGRSVREAFPEIEGQGFFELLDTVYRTGEPYIGTGVPILLALQPGHPPEERYLDFVYQALRDPDDAINGLVAVGVDVTDRKRANEALQESEARYRTLFQSLDAGYSLIELLFEPTGESRNYRFLDVNPAFETITGITGATGQTIRTLVPELEGHWFETYSRVARTGEPIRFVEQAGPFQDRWFEVYAFRLGGDGSNKVAVLFTDITSRTHAEQAVQASDARHTFLLQLADTLSPIADPIAIQAEASRVLGERLGANRVAYFEVHGDDYVVAQDHAPTAPSIAGRHPISSFGSDLLADLLAGRVVIEPDVNALSQRSADERAAFAAVRVGAYVGVPLVKGGRLVAGLAVQSIQPRAWTPTEVAIIEDTAQRTWEAVERVRAEAALRAGEERFRSLVTATTQIVWTSAANGVVVEDSPTWRAFTGQTQEQWLGSGWLNTVHPDDQESIRTSWQQALATMKPLKAIYRLRRHDGEYRWTAVNGVPVLDEAGVLREWVGTNTDITDQKLAEQALLERERQFHTLAELLPAMTWMANPDGHIFWFNRRWHDYTGKTLEQMDGFGWQDIHHPDRQQTVLNRWRWSIASGLPFEMTFPLRGRDGEFRLFLTRVEPLKDADGRVVRWFGMNTDIQEQVQTAEKLQQLATDLSLAARRKDEFLATLAHELRNPLAPISNSLALMALANGDRGILERARTTMERQVAQMVRLIDDLLDVSRITRDQLTLKKERVELASIVQLAVETCQPHCEREAQELRVVLPPAAIVLEADATRLAQVFGNLLNNASKFTPRGGRIELVAEPRGDQVAVTVRDTGIGIAADMRSRVFELFTQVDASRTLSKGGLGIGLALAKRITELHGGSIAVFSEGQDRGSEFVVELPLVSQEDDQAPARAPEGQTPHAATRRILVVDDNRDSAESMTALLALDGHETLMSHDGLDAVEKAASFRPDAILLDIGLPKLDGYGVCRRIREQAWGKDILMIALTGWGQADDRRKSSEAGFDSHCVKPVNHAALMDLLNQPADRLDRM